MSERAFKNVIHATRVAVAKPAELLKKVVTGVDVQRKVRRAVENTILTNEMRSHALNRWLDADKAAPTV
jgi:uncharacterized protein (UPF0147 family)